MYLVLSAGLDSAWKVTSCGHPSSTGAVIGGRLTNQTWTDWGRRRSVGEAGAHGAAHMGPWGQEEANIWPAKPFTFLLGQAACLECDPLCWTPQGRPCPHCAGQKDTCLGVRKLLRRRSDLAYLHKLSSVVAHVLSLLKGHGRQSSSLNV